MTDKPKRVLSADHLEKLKIARIKAQEAKKKLATIRQAEKMEKRQQIDEKYNQIVAKKNAPKEVEQVEEVIETKTKSKAKSKKKPVKKYIEISDSSSDEDGDSDGSDDEPAVEYIVKRSRKKRATPQTPKQYNKSELTTQIARDILKKKFQDDSASVAFRSLFPYHNF